MEKYFNDHKIPNVGGILWMIYKAATEIDVLPRERFSISQYKGYEYWDAGEDWIDIVREVFPLVEDKVKNLIFGGSSKPLEMNILVNPGVPDAFIMDLGNRYTRKWWKSGKEWKESSSHIWQTGSPNVERLKNLWLNQNTGEVGPGCRWEKRNWSTNEESSGKMSLSEWCEAIYTNSFPERSVFVHHRSEKEQKSWIEEANRYGILLNP